ncbi:glycosyltransferase family 2 protein [uncultured Psychroserpens sp.]|uniref:glycosyltransferase family 2 protein n=1 Tax=uncultured Psychroserpens sp. TaxID=255436 RepID=UPI00262D8284|nr:glycosyltransferase family A protein [uncultured Psychroserpens sp.]
MLFKFLKYLQPTNYFSLNRNNGSSIFPSYEHIPSEIKEQLTRDSNFRSTIAADYDLSWQALQKGYISVTKTINPIEEVSVYDNYVFIRNYFHKVWVLYVFFIRILSLHNPLVELKGFIGTKHVKRSRYLDEPITHDSFDDFSSNMIKDNPKVSVIIPTLNRYTYLKDVLKDLERQDYKNFDVYVVDQSQPFQEEFYNDFDLDLHLEFQEEKALWLARNNAIKKSKGDYLLLYDDDSRVSEDWITQHLKVLDYFNADISSGVSISKVGAKIPKNYSFFRISDQLDTGNVLVKREVFKTIGLFDRQFEKQRMGDGEYGLRAYLNEFLNISNPYAKRLHLKVNSGGLRTMGSWDAFRTKKWTSPRPIPSVLYLFRKYYGTKSAKLALLRTVPLSIMPYRFKKNKLLLVVGVFVSILLLPLVCFQVFKSWRLSGEKLKEGALIETLS